MSKQMKSDLAQWLFTILKKRKARGEASPYLNKIIESLQKGWLGFTDTAYIEILENLKDEFERTERRHAAFINDASQNAQALEEE